MSFTLFLKGLLASVMINAPIGPIGILCLRRSITEGRLRGFISGLGVATVDTIYGFVAAFGLTFISSFLIRQEAWIRLIGAGLLCYLGSKILMSKPPQNNTSSKATGLVGAYLSMFFLTLANPVAFLSIAAIFAGLGVTGEEGNLFSVIPLVLGVLVGSILWWFLLSNLIGLLRLRFNHQGLRWINWISGVFIIGFGLAVLLSLLLMN